MNSRPSLASIGPIRSTTFVCRLPIMNNVSSSAFLIRSIVSHNGRTRCISASVVPSPSRWNSRRARSSTRCRSMTSSCSFPSTPRRWRSTAKPLHPAAAPDDPTDAEQVRDLLLCHPDRFKPLKPQSVPMRTLLYLVEQRRQLVGDQTRFVNRLGNTLEQYYPQALDWFEQRDTLLFCDFLTRWPTLTQVKRARKASLETFFKSHNVRFPKVIEARIESIKAATPLTRDVAVITAHQLQAQVLINQLRVTLQAIER